MAAVASRLNQVSRVSEAHLSHIIAIQDRSDLLMVDRIQPLKQIIVSSASPATAV